jgi:hypothetical protein
MNQSILKVAAVVLFVTAMTLCPRASRAQDEATKAPANGGPSAEKSDAGKSDSGKSDADKPNADKSDAGKADSGKSDSGKSDAGGPAKFYGTISAVDTKANTFTVDNETYSIVPESHVTKAGDEDKAATIADAVVGEPARGTYTKTADGKMNVTKVRFGKKTGGKAGGGKGGKKKGEASTTQSAGESR